MNQNVIKLLEELEKNPILLDSLSDAKDISTLYKKSIKKIGGFTINDLKFALQELNIIPRDSKKQLTKDNLAYVSGGVYVDEDDLPSDDDYEPNTASN